jgi:hypothetical protein
MTDTATDIDDVHAALGRLLKPLNGTLDDVLDAASDAGMLITQDRRQRAYLLAWRLAEADITFRDAHDAAATLGSVLCATAEDQVSFERELTRLWSKPAGFWKAARLRKPPEDASGHASGRLATPVASALALISSRPLLIAALVLTVVVIAVGLLVWSVAMSPRDLPATPPTVPVATLRDADLLLAAASDFALRALLALPAAIAAWLAWTWWRPARSSLLSREQGAAERLERFTRPDFNALFRGTTVRLAFDTLRRAVRTESSRVDVPSSLRATVRAAGWPTIRRATQRNSLEVVLFVDREGAADHLAFLAQLLEDRLRAAGATVTRYDFRLTPARLTQVSGRPEGAAVEHVERVVARHVGQRLILIGDAHGLVAGNNLDDELRLRRLLGEFAQVHVLTPTPADCWEEHERRLLQAGFNVAFCDRQGVEDAARISTLVDWTEPLAALIRSIRGDADPFLAHLEAEYHRYAADYPLLQPKQGAPDGPIATTGLSALQIRALVSSLQAWMGSRPALRLFVAIAVFPSVKPAYTFAIADALRQDPDAPGAELNEELYARLARLPWLRDGRFPDWLRLALVRRLTDTEREAMARAHVKLLAPMAVARGEVLAQASLEVARRSLRANMSPDHPMAERLFLATLFGQPPKSDLLRPQASAAMTERLGEQLKLASRIVGTGFFAVAMLCFLFKDSIVLPLLAAAAQWVRITVSPLLPQLPPEVAVLSAVCSLAALLWPRGAASSQPEKPPASSKWARRLEWLQWLEAAGTRRLALGLFSLVICALSFKADFGRATALPLVTAMLSLTTIAKIAFERHPRWNGDLRIVPDIDEISIPEAASRYRLGDTIASGAMLGPALAATGLLLLGGGILAAMLFSLVALSTSWAATFIAVPVMSLAWMAYAAVLRKSVLGSWLLTAPDGRQRHILTDFFSAAAALSIEFIANQIGQLGFSSFTTPAIALLLLALAVFLPFDALGFRPFAMPKPQGDRVRANISIAFLTAAIAAPIMGVLSVEAAASPILIGALFVPVILHVIVSTAAVRIAGVSISQRQRFALSLRQTFSAKGMSIHAALTLLSPLLLMQALVLLEGKRIVIAVEDLSWVLLLAFWPLLRMFGAVPLVEALKARQSVKAAAPKPVFQWSYLDSPWPMALVLVAVTLSPWFALDASERLDPRFHLSFLVAPWICVAAGYRYGRAALGPVTFGLLPCLVSLQSKGGTLVGEPAFVVAMLFWARFAGDATLRRSLLARETLPLTDLLVLATAFAFTLTIRLSAGDGLMLNYDPDWLVLTAAFVIGVSRMPAWRFLLLLGCLALVRIVIDSPLLAPADYDSTLGALGVVPPKGPAQLLLYGLPWTSAASASLVTLLARISLRETMLMPDWYSSLRGSETYLQRAALAVRSATTPAVLFLCALTAWMQFLVLDSKISPDTIFEAATRSPILAFTSLMIGLAVTRFAYVFNCALVVLGVGWASWSLLTFGVFGTGSGEANPFTLLLPAFFAYSVLGLGIRAVAEGRWRIWSISDFAAAARSEWSTLSRLLRRDAARSGTTSVGGAGNAGRTSEAPGNLLETLEAGPPPASESETASWPSTRPTKKAKPQ